jgi:hypothetical protein
VQGIYEFLFWGEAALFLDGVIEPANNPGQNFRKVEALNMRDPAAPSNLHRTQAI